MRNHRNYFDCFPFVFIILIVSLILPSEILGFQSGRVFLMQENSGNGDQEQDAENEDIDWEIFGPTRVNGMVGNGALSVGISQWGEITVLRYPSPSFWDQLDYRTQSGQKSRKLKYFGALENQGAFFILKIGDEIIQLRDLPDVKQEYLTDESAVLKTEYSFDLTEYDLRGKIQVHDFVHHEKDVLVRWVYPEITIGEKGREKKMKIYIIHYQNFAPTTIKREKLPVEDWLDDTQNDFGAFSSPSEGIVVHFTPYFSDRNQIKVENEKLYNMNYNEVVQYSKGVTGIFLITKMFDISRTAKLISYVGFDERCGGGRTQPPIRPKSAFSVIKDGDDIEVINSPSFSLCSADSFNAVQLCDENGNCKEVVFILSAGTTFDEAKNNMDFAENRFSNLKQEVENFWKGKLSTMRSKEWFPLLSDSEKKLCERVLISMLQATDRNTSATVASISTQPPYAEDWPRDGAYFNIFLDIAGFNELSRKRNLFYVSVQSKEDEYIGGDLIPAGSFRMNFYADGMIGGPWDFEIDQVGFVVWSWANHLINFARGDVDFFNKVYPALKLSTYNVLINCKSENGLQCPANEDDNPEKTVTMIGAGMVYAGLKNALKVAELFRDTKFYSDIEKRIEELKSAMISKYSDGKSFVFPTTSPDEAEGMQYLVFPADFDFPSDEWIIDYGLKVIDVLRYNFSPERGFILYEGKWIISLIASGEKLKIKYPDIAKRFKDEAEKYLRILVEEVPTSTWHMGEVARCFPESDKQEKCRYENRIAMPHIWQATLTCLTAISLRYPKSLELMGVEVQKQEISSPSSSGCSCSAGNSGGFSALLFPMIPIILFFIIRKFFLSSEF